MEIQAGSYMDRQTGSQQTEGRMEVQTGDRRVDRRRTSEERTVSKTCERIDVRIGRQRKESQAMDNIRMSGIFLVTVNQH